MELERASTEPIEKLSNENILTSVLEWTGSYHASWEGAAGACSHYISYQARPFSQMRPCGEKSLLASRRWLYILMSIKLDFRFFQIQDGLQWIDLRQLRRPLRIGTVTILPVTGKNLIPHNSFPITPISIRLFPRRWEFWSQISKRFASHGRFSGSCYVCKI